MPVGGYGIDTFGMKNTLIILASLTMIIGLAGWLIFKNSRGVDTIEGS